MLGLTCCVAFGIYWTFLLCGAFFSVIMADPKAEAAERAKQEADKVAGYLKPILERLDRLEKLDRSDKILAKLEGIERKLEL